MEIDIQKLREVCDALFRRLIEEHQIVKVSVDQELYWKLSHEVAFNLKEEPKAFDVGNLSDDWEFIRGIANGDQPIVYQMTELAPLINYIGEVVGLTLGAKGG